jgi:predicted ATPase/class 3 adenylate cyclase
MDLPTGTVTFLFTDIEGSTALVEALGDRYPQLLRDHHRIVRSVVASLGGREVNTEGDSFFIAFSDPAVAVSVAEDVQRRFLEHDWPEGSAVLLRMGLHTGVPTLADGDYVGIDVHRAARIADAGHGGQVLLSKATKELLSAETPVRDLGEHRLKGLREPEWLYQLLIPGISLDFPPLRSLRNTNLPVPATELVGRERDLEELSAMLRDGIRLVTLTGVGGTGKTRLAVAAAWELMDAFPNGIFLVELAPVRDPHLVIPTIARLLGARAPDFDALVDELQGKRTLLVADNFEHVLDAATDLASLVSAAPNLKVLVTSRAALHLTAEREYSVAPLAIPDVGTSDLNDALASPAVHVLADRIQAVRHDFQPTSANIETLVAIARRLDGLPLALELAGAQARHYSPEALLRRLERRLDVLVAGPRDLPERQRTLRAAIDWSYRQLSATEQRLFANLSVFIGGWTSEAAHEICAVDSVLSSLLDASLVRAAGDEDGEPRFSMLETIREFALECLRQGGAEPQLGARHASYFLALAQEAESRMSGPDQPGLLRMLELEHDNIRTAFDWALEHHIETALALGIACQRFWYLHGYAREGLARLEAALERDADAPPMLRARARRTAGVLAEGCADFARAGLLLEQSVELFRVLDQPKDIATTLNNYGAVVLQQGDPAAAHRFFSESLELKRELGDTTGTLVTTSNLAILEAKNGQYESARRRHEETLPSLRELGSPNALSNCLASLGEIALLCGERREAQALIEESLGLRRDVGDKAGIAESLLLLSRARMADDPRTAAGLLCEGLDLAIEIDDDGTLVSVLEARADLEVAAGDAGRAVALRAATGRMRDELGAPFSAADQTWRDLTLSRARERLSTAEYERSRVRGESAGVEEAIAWAREKVGHLTPA